MTGVGTIKTVMEYRCDKLEERLRDIEGTWASNTTRPLDYCLAPNVVLPQKFKMPDFEKFDGTTCPQTHLRMYFQSMVAYADNEKLMMHCFRSSLTGTAVRLMSLFEMDKKAIETFREYAHRWRDAATQVDPPVGDHEAISMFVGTLKYPYRSHLVGSTPHNFMDIVVAVTRVEADVKAERIKVSSANSGPSKKWVRGRKEEETQMI
ncbi:uncharacterized protein LOC131147239 [Malania oleifera]|uniref:uncharacterized protein LOC131147239 n=1 Tax=Malania oleifera TaxID=397392 RepID=UPI0025ADB7A1|nr:uncharacterized protein LOC131147239 [Malania oleifera]